jgi:hypothetical protein
MSLSSRLRNLERAVWGAMIDQELLRLFGTTDPTSEQLEGLIRELEENLRQMGVLKDQDQ